MSPVCTNRSPFVWGQILTIFALLVVNILIGFFNGTFVLFFAAMLLVNIVLAYTNRFMPRRHDYNLFLRQANGGLGKPDANLKLDHPATEPELRAFARFLGEQWLIRDYSLKNNILLLRLPPARMSLLHSFLMITLSDSLVKIQGQGDCTACLSRKDAKSIQTLTGHAADVKSLEDGVSRVMQGALAHFLRGEQDAAKQLLSTVPDEAIFRTEFSKTKGYKIPVGIAIAASILMVFCFVFGFSGNGPLGGTSWDPQPVSQVMARNAVGQWIRTDYRNSNLTELWRGPVHPSLGLLGEENAAGYKRMMADALRMDFTTNTQDNIECRILNGLLNPAPLYHAMATPILSTEVSGTGYFINSFV